MDTIKIKYFDKSMSPLVHSGDWVDLRVRDVISKFPEGAVTVVEQNGKTQFIIKAGTTICVKHGIAMELPFGKEALTRPRSGLHKNYGLLFATSGVIDSGYKGPNDEWMTIMYATRDCILTKDERVCQFRTFEKMPLIKFQPDSLEGNENRGGHGSTGRF